MKGVGSICEVKSITDRDVRVSIRSDENESVHDFVMSDTTLETLISQSKYAKWYLMMCDYCGFPVIFDTETRELEVGEED